MVQSFLNFMIPNILQLLINMLAITRSLFFIYFFRFSTKEAATHAIVAVHNSEINAQPVKCSWGKESGDPNNAAAAAGQVNNLFQFFLFNFS